MEFTLKITADENLLKAINSLTDAIGSVGVKNSRPKVAEINSGFESALAPVKKTGTLQIQEAPLEHKENPAKTDNAEKFTIEDIRALVIEVADKKGKATVKNIFSKFGVNKVSDITSDKYADVIAVLKEAL